MGRFYNIYWSIKEKITPCEHGIRGGNPEDWTKSSPCPQCDYERKKKLREGKEAFNLHMQKLEKEQQRLNAEIFNINEIRKIKKILKQKSKFLRKLSPQEFEDTIANLFNELNYEVKQTSYSADRGFDMSAIKDGKKFLIECKKYKPDKKIGRPDLQKFFAAMVEQESDGGYFVATCPFSGAAIEYASKIKIELIDFDGITSLMAKAYPEVSSDIELNLMCTECASIGRYLLNIDNMGKRSLKDAFTFPCRKCGSNINIYLS